MTAQMMAGAPVADAVMADVAARVDRLARGGRPPGLGTILVGDDPASAGYVARKHEACQRVGMRSFNRHIPATATQADLLAAVQEWNSDPQVDGFIIQNPVPAGFDFNQAMGALDPGKDADGLHPANLGYLAMGERGRPRPATPLGVQAMLAHYGVPVAGRRVVIVGRGPTLGRPLGLLFSLKEEGANAAVTTVHTGVPDWRQLVGEGDIVVGAAGVPNMITPDMIRPGSCVVGGGITWEGRRLLSDVDERCAEVAGWVTPRLGGVGVTTVAMLLRTTVTIAEARAAAASP